MRIKGKGSVFQDVPVTSTLSASLLEWKDIQESFKGKESSPREGSPLRLRSLCLQEYSGEPFSNGAFNLQLRAACRAIGVGQVTAHGLQYSAATILLNDVGKDLREIQELLRHKDTRTYGTLHPRPI